MPAFEKDAMMPQVPPSTSAADSRAAAMRTRRAVFLAAGILLAIQVSPWYFSQGDAPGYLSMARHVARGDGLINQGSPVLWYPPGYSLLISPVFLAGDLPLLAISIFHFLLALVLMCGAYVWARRFAPEGALWVAAISVGTAAFSIHYRRPVSELAFMTVVIWAAICLEFALAESNRRWLAAYALAAAVLFAACSTIRLIGIALAGGAGVRLALAATKGQVTRRRAAALTLAGVVAPALVFAAVTIRERTVAHSVGQGTYLNAIVDMRDRVMDAGMVPWSALVVSEIGRVSIPGMWKSHGPVGVWWNVNMLLYLPLALLLLAGWFRWLRQSGDTLAWMLPFYFAVLTYFRWESGARYWLPMTPAFVACAWYGCEWLGSRRQQLFASVWALHVAATLIFWLGRDLPQALATNARWPEAKAAAAMIDGDRESVAVAEEIENLGNLVALEIDRRVAVRSKCDGVVPPGTQWLILPEGMTAPEGFTLCAKLGGDVLWRRDYSPIARRLSITNFR
jgi:hypothetical protein